MTGRDYITFILSNNLENEPLCSNGKLLGFLTIEEAAAKMNVGPATVHSFIVLGMLTGYELNGEIFVIGGAYDKTN